MKCTAKVSTTSYTIAFLKRNPGKNLMEMPILHVLKTSSSFVHPEIISFWVSSCATAAGHGWLNKINKFQGPYRQLQRNLSTTQPEDIRIESYNCFIQNYLRSNPSTQLVREQ